MQMIRRHAKQELGHNPITPPHADVRAFGNARSLDGNVTGGIAGPDYKHALAGERLCALEIMRVDKLARKAAGIRRITRFPMVTIADHKIVKNPAGSLATLSGSYPPVAARCFLATFDECTEFDKAVQAKIACVVLEVGC